MIKIVENTDGTFCVRRGRKVLQDKIETLEEAHEVAQEYVPGPWSQ